jgi:HK97 family phage major capsid protein
MTLKEQLNGLLKQARDIADAAEKEGRDFTADERTKVAKLLEDARDLKAKLKQQEGDAALKAQIGELDEEFVAEQKARGPVAQPGQGKSLGERFVESELWKAWLKQIAPNGRIPDSTKGLSSPSVQFKHLLKDLVTGSSVVSAGAFVQTDYTGIYEPIGRYPLTLVNLINKRTTTSDMVEFVRQIVQVQQAAPVPEANVTTYTGYSGQVSGEKPEGSMEFEKVQEPVKTIAVWIPATKRALSDAAQIRGIIDQELNDDLDEELEDQLVNGDGTGENFTGLLNTSGILAQPFDTDIPTTTRKAITSVQVTGRARPTGWLINPNDWETIELLKDGSGRYYWGGPLARGPKVLWSLPVAESPVIPSGTALLGDWRKAILWDREQASIQVSDSHADFFVRNMVAILAEMRAAFGVIRPAAFCEVSLTSGS